MSRPALLHDLVLQAAEHMGSRAALTQGSRTLSYQSLADSTGVAAAGLHALGVVKGDRVAVYLPKSLETVIGMFGTVMAGGAMVPINPVLKARQVGHILEDCKARGLITSCQRLQDLNHDVITALEFVICVDGTPENLPSSVRAMSWAELSKMSGDSSATILENDVVAILYTSGSTGRPKGVVLSHRNMLLGAISVSSYLENTQEDRILSLLPLSFDAGLSQLTTAFAVGAQVVLLDFLLPKDVVKACIAHRITGITGVPPLWMQLVALEWPKEASESVRYFANTGGKMPQDTLRKLRSLFPEAAPYLMYGLTEAFRSTYLPPDQIDVRPESIGKAIPNAEVLVCRPDGSVCAAGEEGELVHRGPLVAMGYWDDVERTAKRFRHAPAQPSGLPIPELAVWSGDAVKMDEEGYLYFVARQDDMIKTSGYRVSPTEIEEIAFSAEVVKEALAFGKPHPSKGQVICLVVTGGAAKDRETELIQHFRTEAPAFMVPEHIYWVNELPRNANGKLDRPAVLAEFGAK